MDKVFFIFMIIFALFTASEKNTNKAKIYSFCFAVLAAATVLLARGG
jgi:hypothetical protein